MTKDSTQPEGRKQNAAQDLGKFEGILPDDKVERTGEESTRRAGPDGPDARAVGDTFKNQPAPTPTPKG